MIDKLSPREMQIYLAIAKGETPIEMAGRLGLSVKTVSTYRARLLEKTGLRGNAGVAVDAERRGLLRTCEVCNGSKGGVPGNEHYLNGKLLCDYCSVNIEVENAENDQVVPADADASVADSASGDGEGGIEPSGGQN